MTHEKVDEMLKSYRFEIGRCGHLEVEIRQIEEALARARSDAAADVASLQSPQLTGMPHGSTVSSPTERAGIALASGWLPEYIKQMDSDLAELRKEYSQRYLTVMFVSSWLQGLTERERWIIEHQVIDGEFWKDILARYKSAYSEECSKDSLKRLKSRALEKIYAMAS